MTDTTPNEDDAAVPAEGAPPAEGAGSIADRARRMLDHGDEEAKRPIMDAATGAGDENAVVSAATTSTPSGHPGTGSAERAPGDTRGSGGGRGGSSGGGSAGDDEDGLFPGLPLSGSNQVIVLGLIVAAVLLFGSAIWSLLFG